MVGDIRLYYLQQGGAKRAFFPSRIAPRNADSVWRGDLLLLYVVNARTDGRLDKDAKGFPTGFYIQPREYAHGLLIMVNKMNRIILLVEATAFHALVVSYHMKRE